MVTCTGHIGIHEGADGRTDVRMYVRTLYVRTDVHDVMAIKPNFLTSMGYHIFLSMVLRARAPSARAELRLYGQRTLNLGPRRQFHTNLTSLLRTLRGQCVKLTLWVMYHFLSAITQTSISQR